MHDAARVCVVEGAGDRPEDAHRVLERQRRAELVGERAAIDVVRNEERDVVLLREVEGGHDVRVAQLADRARFLREAVGEGRIARGLRRQDLDRDVTAEGRLIRLVHGAHPAGTDLLDDLVVPERVPGLQAHWSIPSTRWASTGVFRPFNSNAPRGVVRTPSPAA